VEARDTRTFYWLSSPGVQRTIDSAMLSPSAVAILVLGLALVCGWGLLHAVAIFMQANEDVAALHRKVWKLKSDYDRLRKRREAFEDEDEPIGVDIVETAPHPTPNTDTHAKAA
jgi:hypothetical protein